MFVSSPRSFFPFIFSSSLDINIINIYIRVKTDTEKERMRGNTVIRRGFGFQNDWGEIGVSRYRLATLDGGFFSRVMRAGIYWSI